MNNEAIDEFIRASKMIKFKEVEASHHSSAAILEAMLNMMCNLEEQQYNKSIDELFDEGKSWKEMSRIYKKRLAFNKILLNIDND